MVSKGLTYTSILVMVLVMSGTYVGWSVAFSEMNANPNYATQVNETSLKFFNTSDSITERGDTIKRQVNESSSRWSEIYGLLFEGIPNFISTYTGAFGTLTTMLGSLGTVFGIPVWFIGMIGGILGIIALGLFLRTVTRRDTI